MSKAKAATKSAIYQELSTKTELTKKQIGVFFEALGEMIKKEIGKKGPGIFTVPGLLRIKKVEKKATKERMGRNPRTGEPQVIPAKPKRTVVRVRPLKALNEMVK